MMSSVGSTPEQREKKASLGISHMNQLLKAMNESVKPIVSVVRGNCVGITFTY